MTFKQRLFKKGLPVLIAFMFLCNLVSAQQAFHVFNRYTSVTDSFPACNLHLYNGSEYKDYDHRIEGVPYFEAGGFSAGSVTYYNNFYDNVPLMYNMLTDELISKSYDEKVPVQLVNIKVSSFTINRHFFVRLNHDDSSFTAIKTGFYDVLYDGKTELLCKRKVEVEEKIIMQSIDRKFIKKYKYFVFYKSRYEEAGSPAALIRLLDIKKKTAVKYWKQNNIIYKKQPEAAMIAICAYYDHNKTTAAE